MKTVKLDIEKVKELFKNNERQADVLMGIYKMVYPVNWDEVKKVDDFPRINQATNLKIIGMFTAFDREHHPAVLPAGLWLNNGFGRSENESLEDWVVEPAEVTLK